jgi:ribosome-associated protein
MNDFAQADQPLSRTKQKQQAKQIEQLAAQIVALDDNQYQQLELPEVVAREAELARSTRGRGAHKRQLKHFAALLRKSPELVVQVSGQMAELDQVARGEKRHFHQLEDLRDRLCQADTFDTAFAEMLELAPGIERQTIARLARSVHSSRDKRAYREIFRRLRDAQVSSG